ncbi:MAG TPA: hypothetical protein VGC21_00995 [Telluria sp.]
MCSARSCILKHVCNAAPYRIDILAYAGIEEAVFDQALQQMSADLPTTPDGLVKVENAMIDPLLAEVVRPDLRLRLWKAMWQLVYVLLRASSAWGIEAGANGDGRVAKPVAVPDPGQ